LDFEFVSQSNLLSGLMSGVGALSGHPFGIDRKALAADLGFDGVIQNSLDAVRNPLCDKVSFNLPEVSCHLIPRRDDKRI
jgi:argininosuccinate lyase